MNYLAHAFLSKDNERLLIGNFIADHLRGNNFTGLDQGVIEGVLMHRRIDAFSDSHPLFRKSKRLFYNGYEKHSGILVDMYFDHLLARNFGQHSDRALTDFSTNVYRVYEENRALLPQRSGRFLDYVLSNDVYNAYALESGITKVLFHLSHRIGHGVLLNESISLFAEHKDQLEENFNSFFSDAKREFL